MSRLRYNGLATGASTATIGLTLGGSLTSGATSVTFSAALTYNNGTAVPTIVSPDYIPLCILDSATGNLSEIVYLTAYTAAATTGTITRGQEGTTGVAHAIGDRVVGALTVQEQTALGTNAQTGTSYTTVLADAGQFITMTNASASTLTIPPNSSVAYPVGTWIEGAQLGAGQVTLTQGAGVTINGTPGLKVAAQYGTFALLKTATDTWLAFGRLSA